MLKYNLLVVLLLLAHLAIGQASRNYITGPKGGCYYVNSNGNKTYVDRSFCNQKSNAVSTKVVSIENDSLNTMLPLQTQPSQNGGQERTYYRGPQGGCYYISKSGHKVYVDRSVCD